MCVIALLAPLMPQPCQGHLLELKLAAISALEYSDFYQCDAAQMSLLIGQAVRRRQAP